MIRRIRRRSGGFQQSTTAILSEARQFFSGAYQPPQQPETQDLTKLLVSILPTRVSGARPNIREYDRFRYMFGYKNQEDVFLYVARFGQGMVLWGYRPPGA